VQSGLPRRGAKAEIATQDSRDPLDDLVDKVSRCERAASVNKRRPDKGYVRRQAERRERVVKLQSCITVLRGARSDSCDIIPRSLLNFFHGEGN